MKTLPDQPWGDWVKRFVLHVPHYLSYTGEATSGGRQRTVRDVARLVQTELKRECVIVQKGSSNWESADKDGNAVVGLKSRLDLYGDPGFGRGTRDFLRPGDGLIYMGGEDAWPYFARGAKGYHMGVWWDGPHSGLKKWATGIRTQGLFDACRSVACCDTNVINWLRARSQRYQAAANRTLYLPNYVEIERLPVQERAAPNRPLRILFARRFELKRGPYLLLDAAQLLAQRGFPFELHMSLAEGQSDEGAVAKCAAERGIAPYVKAFTNDMDSVYSAFQNADISVVPTIWSEGTSYSCVEAIAAGLPVVTTTVGGLPNLIFPGHNGFVCAPRAEEIAEAIAQYASDDLWRTHRAHCLSMRNALSAQVWTERVLKWLMQ